MKIIIPRSQSHIILIWNKVKRRGLCDDYLVDNLKRVNNFLIRIPPEIGVDAWKPYNHLLDMDILVKGST